MTRSSFLVLVLSASLAGAGCSRPPFGEVEGTLTIDGTPADGVVVYFVPDLREGSSGPTSWGSTDAAGRFTLACMNQECHGAITGKHRVVCEEPELSLKGKKSRVPERYRSPATTPLQVEVRGGKQSIDLRLTNAP